MAKRGAGSSGRVGWTAFFCGPAALLYTVFVVVPLVTALWYSIFSWRGTTQGPLSGLDNYATVLTAYPYQDQLLRAFGHNGVFFVGTMLVQNTVGLALALLLHRAPLGRRLFQTLYSLPYLISPLVVGYLWSMLLSPSFGPVNAVLEAVGLDALARPWLGDPGTALPVVVLVNAWQWVGGPMLIFGAALAAVPAELEESARIDGASAWKTFWTVRFPLILPTVGVVTLLTFIGTFNVFDLVFALGGSSGGPGQAMDVLGLLFYRLAFQGGVNAIGLSSALAMLMFVFVFGISLLVDRMLRRREVNP
ncbi:carbohydrate ABC transporter permease [Allorhizocola rhizosphaerae]|uniref:carbohydrate ABC transporter permease n=1 Tax=Allorhizocola rhizosphaerae TaxID=1872709 RepID=UPI001FE62396|nr:sugar ABC transporter permease [Allorhizocola rhizosphaerae]